MATVTEMVERGQIGGRTAQIVASGSVEWHDYPAASLADGFVRVRTVRSVVSPGTESTFIGPRASNVYLHKHWNEDLRLFEEGVPSTGYPITFGYRAAGEVVESRWAAIPVGQRVFGNWHHTELTAMPGETAAKQRLPDELSWDDGVDVGQMGPICVNAVAFAEGEQRDLPVVVFGAGPVGLLVAQIARAEGAQRVHVVDRIGWRLEVAEALGLEPLLAGDGVDVAATLKRRHGSEGIPVAFECSGSSHALHEAIRVVKRRGLVVAVGFYQGDSVGLRLGEEFHHNGVRISCGQIGNVHPTTTWDALRARTVELCRAGGVVFGGLPRLTVPIEQVAEGIAALRRPEAVLQVAISYGTGESPAGPI